MDNCLFCNIVAKKIPAKIVYEDENTIAFNDINPQAPIHILVIPKKHISGLNDLNDENLINMIHLSKTANQLTKQEGIAESGYRWVINSGKDGGQTVFHLHLHLLGGRNLSWPPG